MPHEAASGAGQPGLPPVRYRVTSSVGISACPTTSTNRGESFMKRLIVLAALAGLCLPGFAATPQQEKMKACNADPKAKELKGAERKKFMSECLSSKGAAAGSAEKKLTPQQEKMKSCNADAKAKALKGTEREKFMSDCLKG